MRVINLFGGPGCGKSTTAAGLFYRLKMEQQFKVELVREYAKDLVYAGTLGRVLPAELLIEQYKRQKVLDGKVDLIITDSPLLLPLFYRRDTVVTTMAEALFNEFDNMNYLLVRSKVYEPYGRRQSEESARAIDSKIHEYLGGTGLMYDRVLYSDAVRYIHEQVQELQL